MLYRFLKPCLFVESHSSKDNNRKFENRLVNTCKFCDDNNNLNAVLGLVLLPMTFLSSTPVECTIHPTLWGRQNYTYEDNEPHDSDLNWKQYTAEHSEEMVNNVYLLHVPIAF